MTTPLKTDWLIVYIALGAGIIGAAHIGKMPPALPLVRSELELSMVTGGWVVSIFSATAVLIGLGVGGISDRVGPWRLVMVGLAAMAVGGILGSFADSGWSLLATRFLEGLGFLAVVVSSPAIIAHAAEGSSRKTALGLWATYFPVGMGLMMVVSPLFLNQFGWRTFWLVLVGLCCLWLLVMAATRNRAPAESVRAHAPKPILENLKRTLPHPGPWIMAFCFFAYSLNWMALMVWLPTFLIESRQSTTTAAALIGALVVLTNAPGNFAAGWLLNRHVPHWALVLVSFMVMALTSIGIFSDALSDGLRLALCLLFSALSGMLPGTVLAAVPTIAPSTNQIGIINGMLVQGSHMGQIIGPPLLALVITLTGSWQASLYVILGSAIIGCLLALGLKAIEGRMTDAP